MVYHQMNGIPVPFWYHSIEITKYFVTRKAQKYHRKISLIMGIITGAFLICWWPYAIIFMLNDNAKYKIVLGNVVVLAYSNRKNLL